MKLDLEELNVDSLIQMLKASFSFENWDAMIEIADKLHEQISIIYENNSNLIRGPKLKRSIPYYFGYSSCAKGIALQKSGKFDEAKLCIQKYADLGWIGGLDEEAIYEVEYYRNIAKANSYVIDLLEGKMGVLHKYVEFIRKNDDEELLPGLITILESSIMHDYSIDWVLKEFKINVDDIGEHETIVNIKYHEDYIYLLAMYYYKQENMYDTINTILEILLLSIKLDDYTGFKKSAALFELLRDHADQSQLKVHHNIMKTIIEKEFTRSFSSRIEFSKIHS